ncbi:MAG TPA: F0F1 ATP synthase subunit delta [Pseudonocardiaceae bacterium]
MQAASRESLATARERLDDVIEGLSGAELNTFGDELFGVFGVLAGERVLRRYLSDPGTESAARQRLATSVFSGKITARTLDTVLSLVGSRWSEPGDLVDAVELLARQVLLTVAEQDGSLEDVEDELFRFGRILDAQPQLRELLNDESAPVDRRLTLLNGLVENKVRPVTLALLRQAVRAPRGRSLDLVVGRLAELAADRRNRSVAHITAATALSDEQEQRLVRVLSDIFGRAVSLQVELDPDLLGGLVIRVGDEVIDGSVLAKLAKARQALPR